MHLILVHCREPFFNATTIHEGHLSALDAGLLKDSVLAVAVLAGAELVLDRLIEALHRCNELQLTSVTDVEADGAPLVSRTRKRQKFYKKNLFAHTYLY